MPRWGRTHNLGALRVSQQQIRTPSPGDVRIYQGHSEDTWRIPGWLALLVTFYPEVSKVGKGGIPGFHLGWPDPDLFIYLCLSQDLIKPRLRSNCSGPETENSLEHLIPPPRSTSQVLGLQPCSYTREDSNPWLSACKATSNQPLY